MKHPLLIILLFFTLSTFTASAQLPVKQHREVKPLLFNGFTSRIEIPAILLHHFISLKTGDTFNVSLPGNLIFQGFVLEKTTPVAGTTSINLRLNNYKDALFNLSITTINNNQQIIRAMVIHRHYADVLLLRFENGRYYLEKQEQRLVLAE